MINVDVLTQEGTPLVAQITMVRVMDEATCAAAVAMQRAVKDFLRRVAELFDPIEK